MHNSSVQHVVDIHVYITWLAEYHMAITLMCGEEIK